MDLSQPYLMKSKTYDYDVTTFAIFHIYMLISFLSHRRGAVLLLVPIFPS